MRVLIWIFIAAAVFVGVQVMWVVFIRNSDDYTTKEQEAIGHQTMALIFVLVLIQFRQSYSNAITTGHLIALFGYDLIWSAVAFFIGWSAIQNQVSILLDIIKINFGRQPVEGKKQLATWLGYLIMTAVLSWLIYLWFLFRAQWGTL